MQRAPTLKRPEKLADNPLLTYSQGHLARSEAIRLLGLHDYAELLVALGDAALPMPSASPQDIADQAASFEKLWRQG